MSNYWGQMARRKRRHFRCTGPEIGVDSEFATSRENAARDLESGLSQFIAAHRTFLFEVENNPALGLAWHPGYLQAEASSMRLIGADGTRKIYLITMKENSTP